MGWAVRDWADDELNEDRGRNDPRCAAWPASHDVDPGLIDHLPYSGDACVAARPHDGGMSIGRTGREHRHAGYVSDYAPAPNDREDDYGNRNPGWWTEAPAVAAREAIKAEPPSNQPWTREHFKNEIYVRTGGKGVSASHPVARFAEMTIRVAESGQSTLRDGIRARRYMMIGDVDAAAAVMVDVVTHTRRRDALLHASFMAMYAALDGAAISAIESLHREQPHAPAPADALAAMRRAKRMGMAVAQLRIIDRYRVSTGKTQDQFVNSGRLSPRDWPRIDNETTRRAVMKIAHAALEYIGNPDKCRRCGGGGMLHGAYCLHCDAFGVDLLASRIAKRAGLDRGTYKQERWADLITFVTLTAWHWRNGNIGWLDVLKRKFAKPMREYSEWIPERQYLAVIMGVDNPYRVHGKIISGHRHT
jgi:hypothetical protein